MHCHNFSFTRRLQDLCTIWRAMFTKSGKNSSLILAATNSSHILLLVSICFVCKYWYSPPFLLCEGKYRFPNIPASTSVESQRQLAQVSGEKQQKCERQRTWKIPSEMGVTSHCLICFHFLRCLYCSADWFTLLEQQHVCLYILLWKVRKLLEWADGLLSKK